MKSRFAISSSEEIWVRACFEFFQKHGFYNWHMIPKDKALHEMMKSSNGTANPSELKQRIDHLYESVGIRNET
jgi:hypothetical protein